MKMKNGQFVTVRRFIGNKLIQIQGPFENAKTAEVASAVWEDRVDNGKYYSDFAWYGPDPEPVGE